LTVSGAVSAVRSAEAAEAAEAPMRRPSSREHSHRCREGVHRAARTVGVVPVEPHRDEHQDPNPHDAKDDHNHQADQGCQTFQRNGDALAENSKFQLFELLVQMMALVSVANLQRHLATGVMRDGRRLDHAVTLTLDQVAPAFGQRFCPRCGSPIYAIRETAKGDISLAPNETTNASIAWSAKADGAYLVSPVLYRDQLYVTKTVGSLSVFNAKTGERVYQGRLGSGTSAFTASTIAADGKLYFTDEDGDVYVIKAGTFETLATNSIGGIGMATPAVSEGVLYFRTSTGLLAIK